MNKYRSKLEERVAKTMPNAEYEPWQIDYSVPHKYTPDFVEGNVCWEVKGFFRGHDISKYLAIHKQMKLDGYEFRMILQNPNKTVRKGAKLTMSAWCDKHSIKWKKA